ncbi:MULTISPECIES: helix-turn-helix domain-containing protein [unclassified Rhizobacter]|uniref:helix-turn-helix domain-containing protein n=1 Tax=unclassified Rhizobacter TaxID=2640088 RepID=UPI0006FADA9D|nr:MULTISPECIES: helix-turn-helix transcriptional regulator [unclassified Rhizobacter]KQU66035.1 transcriptional regulator [Rhizobacter sp. Root29]KQV97825.1 transcriptional regulator [Rhizobacter sp. Root1238]KRB18789.1 transcriptional regulator [Rhizobacter sp. Root16D2]
MSPPSSSARSERADLGPLLRHWRAVRGRSQLDLALEAGISQRHISFIESGRSAPGRQTLLQIAQTLDVPLRERNALLLAAGFAPLYSESPWDAAEMQGIERALRRMLRQQEPFPAVVMDRHWNVLMTNDAAPRFFGRFVDLSRRASPRNLLHLMFDPDGMRPFIANWDDVGRSLIQRVHRESTERVVDLQTQALLSRLLAYPGIDPAWQHTKALLVDAAASALPMVPITFARDGAAISLFSLVTTVGTPQAAASQELRLETMFAVDDASEQAYAQFVA